MTRRHHHLRTAAAVAAAAALLLLAACGSDEPEETPATTSTSPVITAPSPTVDPTEEAEEAAIEALERYYDVYQAAGTSGEWDQVSLADGAQGPALDDLVAFGEVNEVAVPAPWIFEGSIELAAVTVTDLVVEPTPSAVVTACKDDREWSVIGDPPDYVHDGPDQVAWRVEPGADDRWYVTEWAGGDDDGAPCEP